MDTQIERIREASDIVDIIGHHTTLKTTGRVVKGLCPFHTEKTPSFTIWPDRQTFKCFGCNVGGDVFTFVQLKENLTFPEAKRWLADRAGIVLEEHAPAAGEPVSTKTRLERVNRWAAAVFCKHLNATPDGDATRAYLEQRGISKDMWAQFGIGFAPDGFDNLLSAAARSKVPMDDLESAGLVRKTENGKPYDVFRNRLMFPITDATGRVVAFGGRTMGDDRAKYINSPETPLFRKSRQLYGLDQARTAFPEKRQAIVVEGYTDCIMAHQHGIKNTVATLGTAFTADHGRVLRRYVDTVYLVFDGDAAGISAADRALDAALSCRLDVRIVVLPDGQDPFDFLIAHGADALSERLISATPALEWKWKEVEGACRSDGTPAARREAIDRLIDLVFSMSAARSLDEIDRGELLGRLGRLVGLSLDQMHDYVSRARPTSRAGAFPSSEEDRPAVEAPDPTNEHPLMRELLELVLCRPAQLSAVANIWNATAFRNRDYRRAAAAIDALAAEQERWTVPMLIDRLNEGNAFAAAALVVDLECESAAKDNFDARFEAVLERLDKLVSSAEQSTPAEATAPSPSLQDVLQRAATRGQGHHGFAPLRTVGDGTR